MIINKQNIAQSRSVITMKSVVKQELYNLGNLNIANRLHENAWNDYIGKDREWEVCVWECVQRRMGSIFTSRTRRSKGNVYECRIKKYQRKQITQHGSQFQTKLLKVLNVTACWMWALGRDEDGFCRILLSFLRFMEIFICWYHRYLFYMKLVYISAHTLQSFIISNVGQQV